MSTKTFINYYPYPSFSLSFLAWNITSHDEIKRLKTSVFKESKLSRLEMSISLFFGTFFKTQNLRFKGLFLVSL